MLDYLDALKLLARNTALEEEIQQEKIMDTLLRNGRDPKIRTEILKFVTQSQDRNLDAEHKWEEFNQLIKQINKLHALETYTAESQLAKDADAIHELTLKVEKLMAIQHRQPTEKLPLKDSAPINISQASPTQNTPVQRYSDNFTDNRSSFQARNQNFPKGNSNQQFDQKYNQQWVTQQQPIGRPSLPISLFVNRPHSNPNNQYFYSGNQSYNAGRSNFRNQSNYYVPNFRGRSSTMSRAPQRFTYQSFYRRSYQPGYQPQYTQFNRQFDRQPQRSNYRPSYYSQFNRWTDSKNFRGGAGNLSPPSSAPRRG